MATELEKLEVVFTAQFSELNAAMGQIQKHLDNVSERTQRTARATEGAFKSVTTATEAVNRSMKMVRDTAISLGVAFAGLKISEVVRDAAMSAARFETMGVVLDRLSKNTAYSTQEIGRLGSSLEKTGISMIASRESLARMIQGNIDLANSTQLARVAQDAAVIGNINSSDAFQRLVYGIQSAQVEILRTIGLNVNFESSYNRMAATIGKSAAALTEMEKTQARVSEVIRAGTQITGSYEAAMGTAGKQILSMERYLQDMSTMIGQAFLPALTSATFQVSDAMKAINSALRSTTGQTALNGIAVALKAVADAAGVALVPLTAGLGVAAVGAAARLVVGLTAVRAAAVAIGASFGGWPILIGAIVGGIVAITSGIFRWSSAKSRLLELEQEHVATTRELTVAQRAMEAQKRADQLAELNRRRALLEADLAIVRARAQNITTPGPRTVSPPGFMEGRAALGQFLSSDMGKEAFDALKKRLEEIQEEVGDSAYAFKSWRGELEEVARALQSGAANVDTLSQKIDELSGKSLAPGQGAFNLSTAQNNITQALNNLGLSNVGGQITTEAVTKAEALSAGIRNTLSELGRGLAVVDGQMSHLKQGTPEWNAKLEESKQIGQEITNLIQAWPLIMRAVQAASDTVFDKALRDAERASATAGILNPVARARAEVPFAVDDMLRNKEFLPGVEQSVREAKALDLALRSVDVAAKNLGASMGEATRQAQLQAEWAPRIAAAEYDGAYAVRQAQAEMERLLESSRATGNVAEATARAREREAVAIAKAVTDARILARESAAGLEAALARVQGMEALAAVQRQQAEQAALRNIGPGNPAALAEVMRGFDASQVRQAADAMAQIGENAAKATRQAEIELRTIGMSASEREKIVSLTQLQVEYQAALANATGDERDKLEAIYNLSAARITALASAKQNLEAAARTMDALKQAGDAVGQAFVQAIIHGKNLNDVLKQLLSTLLEIFAKQFILAPLQQGFGNLLGGLFGGGGGGVSGSFGGGAGFLDVGTISSAVFSAQGNVFRSPGLAPYRNTIVDKPTVFPFAKGIGMMGEAGAEGIFPLIRTKNGDLGVRAVGSSDSGSASNVVVNVYAPPGSEVRQEEKSEGDMRQVSVYIDNQTAQHVRQPGSRTYKTLQQTFGAQQKLVQR